MTNDVKMCEICGDMVSFDGVFCANCTHWLQQLKGAAGRDREGHLAFNAPIRIRNEQWGVPHIIAVEGYMKCIVCGNSSLGGGEVLCDQCNDGLIGISRAIGTWSHDEIREVFDRLKVMDYETIELFKMVTEIGLRDIIAAQLDDMHAGDSEDERDST